MRRWWQPIERLRHMTGVPMLTRGLVFAVGWAGLLVAMPEELLARETVLAGGALAALAAVFPAGAAVTALLVAVAGAAALSLVGYGTQASFGWLCTVAAAMYLVHSSAALAAVIPYNAIVDRGVLGRWAARTSLVLASCAVLGLLIRYLVVEVSAPVGPVAMVMVGLSAVLGLVYLLFRLAQQRH